MTAYIFDYLILYFIWERRTFGIAHSGKHTFHFFWNFQVFFWPSVFFYRMSYCFVTSSSRSNSLISNNYVCNFVFYCDCLSPLSNCVKFRIFVPYFQINHLCKQHSSERFLFFFIDVKPTVIDWETSATMIVK